MHIGRELQPRPGTGGSGRRGAAPLEGLLPLSLPEGPGWLPKCVTGTPTPISPGTLLSAHLHLDS